MGRLIGIDLGTCTSCVAVLDGGVPKVVPNQEGSRTTPSVVAFAPDGAPLVGGTAKRHSTTNPTNAAEAVIRLLARKFHSAEGDWARQTLSYPLAESESGGIALYLAGEVRSPLHAASLILAKLKRAAEEFLGEAVDEAVVTVPSCSTEALRQDVLAAARLAGLSVSSVLPHATAAALTYGAKRGQGQYVAVYDLGGGTFDVAILEMAGGLYQVRSIGGDPFLGGEDFDRRVVEWILAEVRRESGADLRNDPVAYQRVKEVAERAKCDLSTAQETEIALPFLTTGALGGSRDFKIVLTRQEYEFLTVDLLEQTIGKSRECLAAAHLRPDQIDVVLLVGGQTRDPRVAPLVRRIFGRAPSHSVHPEEGVALGAAIRGGLAQGAVRDRLILGAAPRA